MLVCCLTGAVVLGCSRTAPQATRGTPSEVDHAEAQEAGVESSDTLARPHSADDLAALLDEPVMHHGLGRRADFGSGPEVRLSAITLTAPATWKRTKPSSSYYAAEFALARAGKDTTDGRLLISMGSGSMESNIDVFKGQFDAASEHANREQKEIAGFQVTFVDVSGAYTGPQGQAATATTQPGYRMILAVIPVGEQLNFIKAVGPEQTIAAHAQAINSFVCSLRKRDLAAEPSEAAGTSSSDVRVEPLAFTAPATWKRTKPRSSLVQVEFALPHTDKDNADGRLTLSIVNGTVKDNIDRWKGQFVGTIDKPKQEEREIHGVNVTLVDFAGTFGDQAGMMGPVVNRPDYRMIAAIIPISDQLYIVKAVGPRQTMATHVDAINSFVESVRRQD
jgi:hypothetical protein